MKKTMVIALMAVVMAACGGRNENRMIVEASDIHQKMMQKYDSIYQLLESEQTRTSSKLNSDITDKERSVYEAIDRSLERSFSLLASWEESVVGVPGNEYEHGHDHDHAENNDHAHHDHSNQDMVNKMSDKEILELQKALSTRLDEVQGKIDELLTTVKMAVGDA